MIPSSVFAMLILLAITLLYKKITGTGVFAGMMMALTEDTLTTERELIIASRPVLANAVIYKGALIVLDSSGWAKPGVTATGLIADGVADEAVDNTGGANGDLNVRVRKGIFLFDNSAAADEITKAQIGDACFIVDDCTVAKTSNGATRSIAGRIEDVTTDGVFVNVGNTVSLNGDLVAANNLSDVANAVTARENLGANLIALNVTVVTLVGTGVYRVASPVAGTITKIQSIIEGALGTGNATLTGKIGAAAITDGAITITQAGSAAGDVDVVTPSAARVVAVGSDINFTVGGTNDVASVARITILIKTNV